MAKNHSLTAGTTYLTNYGKAGVTLVMYEKGKSFIGAAVLVNQKNGHKAVVLHLLCQGIEIVLKAVLLKVDFTEYKPQLQPLGHNLTKIAAEVRKATNLHVFIGEAGLELKTLDQFYRKHLLRYASTFDILIDPITIPSNKVLRHAAAIIQLCERKHIFQLNNT